MLAGSVFNNNKIFPEWQGDPSNRALMRRKLVDWQVGRTGEVVKAQHTLSGLSSPTSIEEAQPKVRRVFNMPCERPVVASMHTRRGSHQGLRCCESTEPWDSAGFWSCPSLKAPSGTQRKQLCIEQCLQQ